MKALPLTIRELLQTFSDHGVRGGLVGGCLRDLLLERLPKDWDISTEVLPQDLQTLFPGSTLIPTGLAFGTMTLLYHGERVEITTWRQEGDYRDRRHPSRLAFTTSLEEDLGRRDFTVNGMWYSLAEGLQDPWGGREDLENRLLRAIRDPLERFREDPLRILRGLRFAATLDFRLEEETAQAMSELSPLLVHVSRERAAKELLGFLDGTLSTLSPLAGPILRQLLPGLTQFPGALLDTLPGIKLRLAALFSTLPDPQAGIDLVRTLRLSSPGILKTAQLKEAALLATLVREDDLLQAYRSLGYRLPLLRELLLLQGGRALPFPALDIRDLALKGQDLPPAIPRKERGALLAGLFEAVLRGELPNEREALLENIRSL